MVSRPAKIIRSHWWTSRSCNRTFLSSLMILNAAITCCIVAPPPTSKKFAGSPPCSLIMSIVAIAKPAPFTSERVHVIEMKYHLIAIIIYKWYRILFDVALEKTLRSFRWNVSYSSIVNKQNKYGKTTCRYLHHCCTYRTPLSYDSISTEKREVRP